MKIQEIDIKYKINGQISHERHMLNGIPHGYQKYYYGNGNLSNLFHKINGITKGMSQTWFMDSRRSGLEQMNSSESNGVSILFYYAKYVENRTDL